MKLTQRTIFIFWLPLVFSWLLMTFEGPWIQAVISRKPDAELQLAAFGLVFSLSVLIEAPVIMLLATGSALGRDRQALATLRRFVWALIVFVTVLAALMAFTPLLDLYLGGVLGVPQHIIDATRPGMVIMILWSGFIGYRRFVQGVLIRHDRTRVVGIGTIIRIIISAGIAFGLGAASDMPGSQIGALALVIAVGVEAVYAFIAARPTLAEVEATEPRPGAKPLTLRGAAQFHLPLAVTSIVTLLVRPVIESGLASAPNAEQALAAWPVVFSIFLVLRAGGLSFQEVVITLSRRGPEQATAIRRFTWSMALALTAITALLAFTPLIDFYIDDLLGVPATLHGLIIPAIGVGLLIPFLTVFESYYRGLLMIANRTGPIYQGMLLSFGVTFVVMAICLRMGIAGVTAGVITLTAAGLVDVAYLIWAMRRNTDRLQAAWVAAAAGD